MRKILIRIIAGCFIVVIGLLSLDVVMLFRPFDNRSIIGDSIVGAQYYVISVDGMPTERVKHGFFITKVPFALVNPGNHTLQVSKRMDNIEVSNIIELTVSIDKKSEYRISQKNGKPILKKI